MDHIKTLFLLALLLPLFFFFIKHFKFQSHKLSHLPPGPKPWPIVGNILDFGKNPHASLANLAKIHGPLISLQLGSQLMIVGSSPAAAMEILRTHDRIFAARHLPHAIHVRSPEVNKFSVVWASKCDEDWRNLRTLLRTEFFSAKAVEAQAVLKEKKVGELVKFLSGRDGKVVKIAEVVFITLLNTFSTLFFSKDFSSLEDGGVGGGVKQTMRMLLEIGFLPNLADYFSILSELDLQGLNKKFMKGTNVLFDSWDILIKGRRETKSGIFTNPGDFLDVMLANGYSNDQINYLLFDLFTAGTDTSTSTTEWAMTELIKNPEIMAKLRKEIANEIKGNVIKESDLSRLSYLNAFVKETLRLHSPIPIIPHHATETCNLMGYTIPKDTQVWVNLWAILRDHAYWTDPLTFEPNRFLNSNIDFKGNDFEYLPFGSGRRMCPGVPLATKTVPYLIATLVNSFDWSLPTDMCPAKLDMKEKFGITLAKEQPLLLIPRVRK